MTAFGFTTPGELDFLHRLASASIGTIVEIGSFQGASTIALATATETSKIPVYAIDPHEPFSGELNCYPFSQADRAAFMTNILDAGVVERTKLINLPSAQVVKCWNKQIGLLFLDGAHEEAAVFADLVNWAKFVKPSGIIALHDCVEDTSGPRRALARFLATHQGFAIKDTFERIVTIVKS